MSEQTEPQSKPTKTDAKQEIRKLAEKLQHEENKKRSGASSRTPKGRMLDASALEKKDPGHHYLYVNTDSDGNIQNHIDEGYQAVGEDECKAAGVRHRVNELVLMRVPREVFEERVAEQKELHKSRLEAHRAEFRAEVESVVRELRDRGMSEHDIRRILVDE